MNNVRLISYTESYDGDPVAVKKADVEGLIAYCARVSNPSNQNNEATAHKLIKYLIKHKHWSPLEMVNVCIEIETTRDIGRQILRHRSFSFQEFSQRYADPTKDLEFVTRECRLQDDKNRQNSIELSTKNKEHNDLVAGWIQAQERVIDVCNSYYTWAEMNGIAKEQARALLPEGLTMSRMYMNGTLRSWVHYIDLRSAHGTQKEHMDVAEGVRSIFKEQFPTVSEALDWIS